MATVEELIIKLSADNRDLKNKLAESEKSVGSFGGSVGKLGPLIAGAFAIGSIKALGSAVIDITGKFQSYNAVLVNTLGSAYKAEASMAMIQKFAAQTPFSVDELTSAFVKLANRGFVPTGEQMRKLGDISSSVGKSFDQLTEALLDATTGEFERLKEFGIRAEKNGDKVKFTFKGVTKEVNFTSKSIQDYILSLGDAEGVSSSMAAISQTLEGRISNLGDAWDQFLLALGSNTGGIMSAVVGWMTKLIEKAADVIKSSRQLRKEMMLKETGTAVQTITSKVESKADELDLEGYKRKIFYEQQLRGYIAVSINETKRLNALRDDYNKIIASSKGSGQEQSYWNILNNLLPDVNEKIKQQNDFRTELNKIFQENIINTKSQSDAIVENTKNTKEQKSALDLYIESMNELWRKQQEWAKFDVPNATSGMFNAGLTPVKSKGITTQGGNENLITKQTGAYEKMTIALKNAADAQLRYNNAQNASTAASQAFMAVADAEINSIDDVGKAIWNTARQIIASKLAEGIASAVASALESVPFPANIIAAGIAGGAAGALFNKLVPKLAAGGIAYGTTNAIVGEYPGARTNPEVIAPLDKLQTMLGGSQRVEVYGVLKAGDIYLSNKRGSYLKDRRG